MVDEIVAGPEGDPARGTIENGWGSRAVPRVIHADLLEWGLGPGETSVLAVALEQAPAVAVLDDAAARRCAKVIGVPVIGTLGIIIRAKKLGLLSSASETLKALRDAGLHLDHEVIAESLHFVGESWDE